VVDVNALAQILSIRNGVWAAAALIALGVFRLWHALPAIMERLNERRRDRASIEGEQYARMDQRTRHLEDRCDELERREDECRTELNIAKGRIAELEGYMTGQGKARQDAAGIVALDRLENSKKAKPDG
jgi:chromosome segregation ATPase